MINYITIIMDLLLVILGKDVGESGVCINDIGRVVLLGSSLLLYACFYGLGNLNCYFCCL
jgi:hypothetical protein